MVLSSLILPVASQPCATLQPQKGLGRCSLERTEKQERGDKKDMQGERDRQENLK